MLQNLNLFQYKKTKQGNGKVWRKIIFMNGLTKMNKNRQAGLAKDLDEHPMTNSPRVKMRGE